MQSDIDRILISRDQIAGRVKELAASITADFSRDGTGRDGTGDDGAAGHNAGDMTIVAVMTGAFVFCSDLIRHIPIAMKMGLFMVSSYPGAAVTSMGSQALARRMGDVRGRNVLVVDDILDSGGTLKYVVPMIKDLGAATVRSCVLLRKDRPAARTVNVDYVGFDIPDEFIVGYGLDFNDYYRNLPDIATLKPSVFQSAPKILAPENRP
jgi:hypoxanthine phosphoribosyltransferase